jgi:SpoVK/Ycf46/Vps4 family AAA+-type ATPase
MSKLNLANYMRAGYPAIYLQTAEEGRAELMLLDAAKELNRKVTFWSHSEGWLKEVYVKGQWKEEEKDKELDDPVGALQKALDDTESDGVVYVFRDIHPFFEMPKVRRMIRDICREFKSQQKMLICLSPVKSIPQDLERDLVLLEFDLPSEKDILLVLDNLMSENKNVFGKIEEEEKDMIIQSAMGLTIGEAENAIAKAAIDKKKLNLDLPISRIVMKEKSLAVKKSGILEIFEAVEKPEDVGGLNRLKRWLKNRVQPCFTKEAKQYGLPSPKGVMLVGLPGCGKSLAAKAASNLIGVPLIRFDVGKVFGSLVGQSEANVRTAINTIDAVGRCIVWIDELDKAFAGMGGSGETDGGTGKRVFGTFITWMQEKKSQAFIMATVNRIDLLPDELLRKGRFDEIFFVGLPSERERKDIFEIQIRKHGRDPKKVGVDELVKQSRDYSGAEIEQAVIGGLFHAYHMGGDRQLTKEHILAEMDSFTPLAKSRAKQLETMANWAKENATPASDDEEVETTNVRKLRE